MADELENQEYRVEVALEVFRLSDAEAGQVRGLCQLSVHVDVTAENVALALYRATLPELGQKVGEELGLPERMRLAVLAQAAGDAIGKLTRGGAA